MSVDHPNAPYAIVVDDEPMIVMDACDILADAGFECTEACSAEEALQLLHGCHDAATLLFTDVDMPGGKNGFALARHVAQHWPNIEIVVASGNVLPEPGEMPAKATFISKPFNARTIYEHLREKLPDDKKPSPLKS